MLELQVKSILLDEGGVEVTKCDSNIIYVEINGHTLCVGALARSCRTKLDVLNVINDLPFNREEQDSAG